MRRPMIVTACMVLALAAGLAWLLSDGRPTRGAGPVEVAPFAAQPSERAELAPIEDEVAAPRAARVEVVEPPDPGFVLPATPLVLLPGEPDHFVARVVDDASRVPIAGALAYVGPSRAVMHADSQELERSSEVSRHLSDGSGYIEFDVLDEHWTAAQITAPGYGLSLLQVTRQHPTRAQALEVRLVRSARLEVLVLDETGVALADVRVVLSTDYHNLDSSSRARTGSLSLGNRMVIGKHEFRATTGGDGRCRFEDLPSGAPLALLAAQEGRRPHTQSAPVVLEPGESREIELRLGAGARILGSLREPGGAPVAAAQILLQSQADGGSGYLATPGANSFAVRESSSRRSTVTDAAGRFEFDDVPDGSWFVAPAPDGSIAPRAEAVQVDAGRADREVHLTAWRDLYIRGVVRTPSGQPHAARVSAHSAEQRAGLGAEAAESGAFTIGPLAPGTFTLQARVFGVRSAELLADSLEVEVEVAAGVWAPVVVLTLRAGSSISGRVLDAGTGSFAACSVVLAMQAPEPRTATIMTTATRGRFSFSGLTPGVYGLWASTPDGQCASLSGVRVAENEALEKLELWARPGAQLRITYNGALPFANFKVALANLVIASDGIQRGASVLCVVPPGRLSVNCVEWIDGTPHTRSREVVADLDAVAEVTFGDQD